jgi:hypothetical protein
LLFHTRVQAPQIAYPLWISEGLATAFETQAPNNAFGPDHDFAPRREGADDLIRSDRFLPLDELIAIMDASQLSTEQVHAVYNQSYALVTWMAQHRREQLRDYLMRMLTRAASTGEQPLPQIAFEAAFGPIERVQQDWLRHERERRQD